MVSVTWLCSGLKVTFLAASSLSNSIKLVLRCQQSSMVSIKILFQAYHCFILYINDLLNASELTDPRLFADDTSLIFSSHSNPNFLESVLNDKLHNIDAWLISFQLLQRNLTSSFFKPRQKKFNSSISLSFGGKPLKQSNTI